MLHKTPLLFLQCLLLIWLLHATASHAANHESPPHTWRSALVPENWAPPHELEGLDFRTDRFIQDYSYAGYHRGERPLPSPQGPTFDVVASFGADPSGETDSTHAIQSAIDAAEARGGGVVWIPEGFYRLSVDSMADSALTIERSNIVLRGAGASKTFLFNETFKMRGKAIIRAGDSAADWGKATSGKILLRKDYPGPTIELALESIEGLETGGWIAVHNPDTEAFVQDLNMAAGADGVDWTGKLSRPLVGPRILRQITSVDSRQRTIRLDAPTRWSLLTRDGACVYKIGGHAQELGLEGFSIGNKRHPGNDGWGEGDYRTEGQPAYDVHGSYAIRIVGVINSWLRDVRTYNPGNDNGVHVLSNALQVEYSRGLTVSNCSFQYPQYGGGGGNGYAIRLNSASENLVIDTEVGHCRHGLVTWRMENSGNVFFRNYDHHTGEERAGLEMDRTRGAGSDHHGWFSHSNLFDSTRIDQSYLEAAYRGDYGGNHGMTASQVLYWNNIGLSYLSERDYIIHSEQFGYGYIIGTRGHATDVALHEKRPGSAARTAPIDYTEGIGRGETLDPTSIYLYQLQRRLRLAGIQPPAYILRGVE